MVVQCWVHNIMSVKDNIWIYDTRLCCIITWTYFVKSKLIGGQGGGGGGGGGGQSKIRAANENKLIKTQNKRMKLTKMTKWNYSKREQPGIQ